MEYRLRLHARDRTRNRSFLLGPRMLVIALVFPVNSACCSARTRNTIDESRSNDTICVAAPISVSYFESNNSVAGCSIKLRPGFFLSNEPGYYKEGDFGVRLENILEVISADKSVRTSILLIYIYRIMI